MMKLTLKNRISRKLIWGLFVSVCLQLLISSSFSQISKNKSNKQETQAQKEVLKWRTISEQLTKDIIDDTKSDYPERPLILAKLAGLWWENDNDLSLKWLKMAVNEVTFDRLTETDAQRIERMEVAAKLIKLILPRNKELGEKLIEYVTKKADESSSNLQNADELVKTALQIVDKNPTSAKMLGTLSLKYGQSYQLFRLIRELNLKNEKLAENLLSEALLSAERNRETDTTVGLLSSLSNLVFRTYKGKSITEKSKKDFLNTLFNLIFTDSPAIESQDHGCNFISTAADIMSSYETYFPEKAIAIRQKAKTCENLGNGFGNVIKNRLREDEPETVEEYIKAAKETDDNFTKANYFQKAVEKLFYAGKYEEVLSLLQDMNKEDKDVFGDDSWDSWWTESARKAAVEYVKDNNLSGAYRIINKTPSKLRPGVQSGLAKEFKDEDKTFAIQMLDDARKGLNALEIEPKSKAGLLIYITKQYAEIAPYEMIDVFGDTVKAVNKTDAENPENERIKDYAPFSESILLPISIIETDELAAIKILSDIDSANSRIRFRLGFLEQSLKKLDQAKIQMEKMLKAKQAKND